MVRACNPKTSKPPILDSSSGDPDARSDPKSIASIGANIQAMTDQANADKCFDQPPSTKEGFKHDMKDHDSFPSTLIWGGMFLLLYALISESKE